MSHNFHICTALGLLELAEVEALDREGAVMAFQVALNGDSIGAASFLTNYPIGLAIKSDSILIWAGSDIYHISLKNGRLTGVSWEGLDILAIFPENNLWYFVDEATVVAFTDDLDIKLREIRHDEVFLECKRSGQNIELLDLQQRRFSLSLLDPTAKLSQLSLIPETD
jgi:hypothetical protein